MTANLPHCKPMATLHLSVRQRWRLVYDGMRARDFRIDYVTEENPVCVVELSLGNCTDLTSCLHRIWWGCFVAVIGREWPKAACHDLQKPAQKRASRWPPLSWNLPITNSFSWADFVFSVVPMGSIRTRRCLSPAFLRHLFRLVAGRSLLAISNVSIGKRIQLVIMGATA